MNKKLQTILIVFAAIIAATGTMYGAFQLGKLLDKKPPVKAAACSPTQISKHIFTIEDDKVSPARIDAKACDTLTITNLDSETRVIAFGKHDHHVAYEGVGEKSITQGQSLTVSLEQVGTFQFHDHNQEEVSGTFTVK